MVAPMSSLADLELEHRLDSGKSENSLAFTNPAKPHRHKKIPTEEGRKYAVRHRWRKL
jgi:hypothetical protein